jgi:hypothetical protein
MSVTLHPARRAIMVAGLVMFLSLGMLAFAADFLLWAHDPGAGLPLLVAGAYGAWQVASTPFELTIGDGSVRTRGLRPVAVPIAELDRVEVVGSWRGGRQHLLRRDGTVALDFDAGIFDQKVLGAALSAAGLASGAGRRPGRRR